LIAERHFWRDKFAAAMHEARMAAASPLSILPITAVILTHNEGMHIARAIASLDFVERVVVVDSGSSDNTIDLARAAGADIYHHPFINHADQFQWALENTGIVSEWTLRLDADEIIEADLAARLRAELPQLPKHISGINFKRKHVFMGRWVRHGGRFPLVLLRLWRTGQGRIEARWMDEHMLVESGETITIDGGFADVNLNDSLFFTDKHNRYATREALDVLLAKYGLAEVDEAMKQGQAAHDASTKRRIKERIYNRLPFGLGPLLYFLWRFIFQLGFLDGREGRIYHVLQGFWYRFLVDVRKLEFERAMQGAVSTDDRLARLSAASGYSIEILSGSAVRSSRGPIALQGLPE